MLEELGCSVEVAADGRAAVQAFDGGRFDLVLMDCMMPVLDGYQATGTIRALEADRGGGARTPVVALTASAMVGERERCLRAGMDDYLTKPFRQAELEAVILRWAGAAARSGDPASPVGAGGGPPPPAGPSTEDGLDRSVLDQLRKVRRAGAVILPRVLAVYLRDTPGRIRGIRRVLEAGEMEAVAAACHSLRSSSAMVGATRLADLPGDLEARAEGSPGECTPSSLAALKAAYTRVETALASVLKEEAPAATA
jgi:CheY-like chemotaxis protein